VCQDRKQEPREKSVKMSSVKQQEQSSLDQTQQQESETPQAKPSTTDRVVDSEYKVDCADWKGSWWAGAWWQSPETE
jgi:hypothetical protein